MSIIITTTITRKAVPAPVAVGKTTTTIITITPTTCSQAGA
jgi:hypothetical protein